MPWWKQQSNNEIAHLLEQGHQLMHAGQLAEALPVFAQCVALEPRNGSAWSYYGWALLDLKRFDQAVAALDNATKYAPNTVAAWYNKGVALWRLGRIAEAIEQNDRALELNPNNALAWYQKGLMLGGEERAEQIERIGDEHVAAFEAFSRAAALEPGDAATWLRRGRLAWRIAHSVQAMERAGAHTKHGWQYYFQAALASFDRVLELAPDDPATLFDKGRALKDFGYYAEARDAYRRLVHVANHPNDWYQLALVNRELENTAEAIDSLAHALALDPSLRARVADDFEDYAQHAAFVQLLAQT